jgi:DNA-binding CsgD family transcriptional regulator
MKSLRHFNDSARGLKVLSLIEKEHNVEKLAVGLMQKSEVAKILGRRSER